MAGSSNTDAITRRGIHPYTYKASGSKSPNYLEDCCTPERVYDHRSSNKFARNGSPDKGGSLSDAVSHAGCK